MNITKRIKYTLLVLLLLPGLILSGCSGQAVKPDGSVYTIADPNGDWGFPSPWGHYQRGPGYIRMSLIFDTLVWKDEEGLVPALASEWDYDYDSRTYTFVLEEGILWHDGENLTADDVVFTFEYMKKHPYPWGDLSSVEQVSSEGDRIVKITLQTHFAPFLSNVAASIPVIPRHIWEDVEDPAGFTDLPAVIGSGPFKYADYNKEQGTYLYQANEQYYGGKVKVEELKFIKANPQMAAASLARGEINAAAVEPEMAEQLQDKFTIITESGSSNIKLMFNHSQAPLSSKDFRQAVAYAISRDKLADKAQRGYAAEGNPGIYAPGSNWFAPGVSQYDQDLQMVQELMTGLGYRLDTDQGSGGSFWTKDGRELNLKLLCDPDLIRTAEVLKEQLEQAGFRIDIQSVEAKVRDSRIASWDYDLALNLHGGLGGDPEILNKFILVDDFNSARYYDNKEMADLITDQKSVMDEQLRTDIVHRIQKLYAEDIPALTLLYPNNYWAHDGKIPLYYTGGGIAIGVPIPLNKLSFIQ